MREVRVKPHAVVGTQILVRRGQQTVIGTSTFTIPTGSLTAVIGPNGSGKSTLLNAIAGLHPLTSGDITFPLFASRQPRIAYVLQTTRIDDSLPVTVKEVVTMGRYPSVGHLRKLSAEDRKAIEIAMLRTGIHEFSDRHINQLSGGQRQRTLVAQGLAQEHDILLLDEPMTGIDVAAAQAIDEVIHDEISDGCAVVLTTHDLSEAKVADHVILLSGRVVAQGSPAEVLTAENLAEAYGAAQLHIDHGDVMLDDPAHGPNVTP